MIKRFLIGLPLVLVACVSQATRPTPDTVTFVVESEFGEQSNWVKDYLSASAEVLIRLMDSPDYAPPREIKVTLTKDPEGEHGGWASSDAIGYTGDRFPKEAPYVWILTHELTNLFAAHYGKYGGFPSDWWSNGRSPFPTYLSGLVLDELGQTRIAEWLRSSNVSEPDYALYLALHERYGFGLFAQTLRLLREDDLDLGEIEPPWPYPSQRRTAYTIAYLSLAANENLTGTVMSFSVGRKPSDWDDVHPEIPFEEYVVTAAEVEGIERSREAVFGPSGFAEARALYRAGKWREALQEFSR